MTEFSQSSLNLRSSEIRDLMSLANKPNMILFSGGMPDNQLFPINEIDRIYQNLTSAEKQMAMQYGPTPGLPPLLESLGNYLEKKGLPVKENKLMITTGSLQAINIITKVLVDPGDDIVVENPCFIGALSTFKSYQARLKPVPLTPDGIDLKKLSQEITSAAKKPKFIYLTPNFHNPAGTLYTADRKKALIKLLQGKNIPLLEDDVYSDLFFHDDDQEHLKTIKAINPANLEVCYTGSFSKILGPGLRLGWMLVPEHIYEKCELVKQAFDACSPSFTQMIAYKFLESGAVFDYTNRVRLIYKKRAEVMINALQKHLPEGVRFTKPRGGFYIWLELPEQLNATDILKRAIDKGVVFVTGKTFDPDGEKNNFIRLSYCNASESLIEKGIPLIAETIKELLID